MTTRAWYLLVILGFLILFVGCGHLINHATDSGTKLIQESGNKSGVGKEIRDGESPFAYWPELLFGSGGLITIGTSIWLGRRSLRRRKERNTP